MTNFTLTKRHRTLRTIPCLNYYYHVSLLLADQLQDKIQENSPLSLDFL